MRHFFNQASLSIALILVGCSESTSTGCMYPTPLFAVDVLDAASGRPAAFGALVIVTKGGIVDTSFSEVTIADSLTNSRVIAGAARNRDEPGVYDVVVKREGFSSWTTDDVEVPSAACNSVETVHLTAQLVRLP